MSLNPCCSGQWSRTQLRIAYAADNSKVLILVVVDNGLVHVAGTLENQECVVLILVVVDNGLVLSLP